MSLFKTAMPGGRSISGRAGWLAISGRAGRLAISGRAGRLARPLLLGLPLLLALSACDPNFPWIGPGTQYPGWTLPPVDTTISTTNAPPAPQAETEAPLPQGPAGYFVWDPGHWHWTGQEFVWLGGHYVERPYRGSTWVPGAWGQDEGKTIWIWTPGHWR